MITQDPLKRLYGMREKILVTSDIIKLGFTKSDIEQLVNKEYIYRLKKAQYMIDEKRAKKTFEENIMMNAELSHACADFLIGENIYSSNAFYVVSTYLKMHQYGEALKIVIKMFNTNNKLSVHNVLLVSLILFKNLTIVEEPYESIVVGTNPDDLYNATSSDEFKSQFSKEEIDIYSSIVCSLKSHNYDATIKFIDGANCNNFNPFLSLLIDIFRANYFVDLKYKSQLIQAIASHNYELAKELLEHSINNGNATEAEKDLLDVIRLSEKEKVSHTSQSK